MVTIKDFIPGSRVYALQMNFGRTTKAKILERTVLDVGRKYVTVSRDEKYEEFEADYLHEKVDYGEAKLLFATKQAAEEYLEAKELKQWLQNATHMGEISLEQLRAVKRILAMEE